MKEAPKFQLLTLSIVTDKFKINGAVARKVLRDLHAKGLIKQVGDHHSSFTLYTGTQLKSADAAPAKKGQAKEAPAKEAPAKE